MSGRIAVFTSTIRNHAGRPLTPNETKEKKVTCSRIRDVKQTRLFQWLKRLAKISESANDEEPLKHNCLFSHERDTEPTLRKKRSSKAGRRNLIARTVAQRLRLRLA